VRRRSPPPTPFDDLILILAAFVVALAIIYAVGPH